MAAGSSHGSSGSSSSRGGAAAAGRPDEGLKALRRAFRPGELSMVSAAPPTAPSQTLPGQASTRVRYDSGREKWKAERLLPNRRFLGYFPT
eukprot:COSAG01_NODE_11459_length_1929_cov_7.548087_1_plen_90_part_10